MKITKLKIKLDDCCVERFPIVTIHMRIKSTHIKAKVPIFGNVGLGIPNPSSKLNVTMEGKRKLDECCTGYVGFY